MLRPVWHSRSKLAINRSFSCLGLPLFRVAQVDVVQEGSVRIKPVLKFNEAGLHPVMLKNVELAGYDVPTPIQQYTMPAIFEGHDIVACAQTGKYPSFFCWHSLLIECRLW